MTTKVDYRGNPVQPGMRLVNGIQVREDAPLCNVEAAATAVHEKPILTALVPDPEPVPTDLPPTLAGWLTVAREARENRDRWAEIEAQAIEKIKEWLGDREEATVNGRPAISWKPSKPGTQLDGKALERDHPDIYATYLVPKKAARPFKILEDGK